MKGFFDVSRAVNVSVMIFKSSDYTYFEENLAKIFFAGMTGSQIFPLRANPFQRVARHIKLFPCKTERIVLQM